MRRSIPLPVPTARLKTLRLVRIGFPSAFLFFVSSPGRTVPRLLAVGGQRNQELRNAFEIDRFQSPRDRGISLRRCELPGLARHLGNDRVSIPS